MWVGQRGVSVHPWLWWGWLRTRMWSECQFTHRLGSSLQGWMNFQQRHLRSHFCEFVRRCACYGKFCGKPPSLNVPVFWPPICSHIPQHGSPSGRTGHHWSPDRSRQIYWVWCCGLLCRRQSVPPGTCPWILRLHRVLRSVGDAPGRAESLRESLQMRRRVAILALGAQLEPLPPALCTPTETWSPRSLTYRGTTPVKKKAGTVRHIKTNYMEEFLL